MKNKFLIRQLPALNAGKSRQNFYKESPRQYEQIKDNLKNLTECVMLMTQQLKDMKKNQWIGQNQRKEVESSDGITSEGLLRERMEKRFQDVSFCVPVLKLDISQEQRQEQILIWLTKVCKTVFSVGFNLYETGVLDINKVKAYCSQNVLRNLLYFSQNNNLTQKQLEIINKFLQADLLPYFCQKYPESEQAETSAKFSSDLIERDQLQHNDYDLVYKSNVSFAYQESGNYNSQIMKFLNFVIQLPNKNLQNKVKNQDQSKKMKEKKERPLNQMFFSDMENIFRMVESENNTINMQRFNPKRPTQFQWTLDETTEKQRQQYQQKVKSYTSFQIGQKLSKNFKPYSDLEIESGNLTLKNSEIIRVLTKWCEELETCFNQNTVSSRETPFRMKNGSQRYLQMQEIKRLIFYLLKQKQEINKKIQEEISQNNFKHQSEHLKQKVNKELLILSESEAVVGQFASVVFKNNQSYLIYYLNALIHGINKGCRQFCTEQAVAQSDAPQLITFNIGDLMRCKCSSKEKEIIALYKEIQRRHKQPNSGIKIIRVKNRLNKGNKDILMNLLYRGQMVVEMQLAIKSDKSKFIECSYNFNHYLYELRRAQFGPIMEMCNIWVSKDLKSKFYLEKVEKLNKRKVQKQCLQICCDQNKAFIKLPFRCSICNCFYSSSSEVEKNNYCQKCSKYTCFLCQLEIQQKQRQSFFNQVSQIKDKDFKKIQFLKEIPSQGGLLMSLKSKKKIGHYFVTQRHHGEYHLFQYKPHRDQVSFITKFKSQKFPQSFLKQNLICSSFQIYSHIQKLKIQAFQPIKKYFINKYLTEAYDNQKNSIYLVDRNFTQANIILHKITEWPRVTQINLSQNSFLFNIDRIVDRFPNAQLAVLNKIGMTNVPEFIWDGLKVLHLQRNNLQNIDNLAQCTKLQQLRICRNRIKALPENIDNLKQLKTLHLDYNGLSTFPKSIGDLKLLQLLKANFNQINKLPEEIGGMVGLKKLYVESNRLIELPASLGNLKSLQELYLGVNKIKILPQSVGSLPSLKIMNLIHNSLEQLPEWLCKLKSLQKFITYSNLLAKLPENIGELSLLTQLSIQLNKIKELPKSIGKLQNLKLLNANKNQIRELPADIGNLQLLTELYFEQNKLEILPDTIGNLQHLQKLNLIQNCLKELPQSIGKLQSLITLQIDKNNLQYLPQTIGNLKSLKTFGLGNNKVKQLPQQIGNLQELEYLYISWNHLKQLPKTIGQLQSLKQLRLEKNMLQYVPDSITDLKSLKLLNLSFNKLKSFPQSIDKLESLEQLYLRLNKLEALPQKIINLKSLRSLDIALMNLKQVPLSILHIKTLKSLFIDIINQNITQLIEAQARLCKLDIFRIFILYRDENKIKNKQAMIKMSDMYFRKEVVNIQFLKYEGPQKNDDDAIDIE